MLDSTATNEAYRVDVSTSTHRYPVLIGDGALAMLPTVIPECTERVVVVTQPNINVAVHVHSGYPHVVTYMGDGESSKTVRTVEQLCRAFAKAKLGQSDSVIAVGGGVVTDTVGFAASIYLGGINVIHVPTTLLGQVDAAIGGKTAVNLDDGKNLVGRFWQPCAVVSDTSVLHTLPPPEILSGYGEIARCELVSGEKLDGHSFPKMVAHCVRMKADVIAADATEKIGLRALINYGHTLGHAIEIATSFEIRHGEAVAIGLMFSARLAHYLGRISMNVVDQHMAVLRKYKLPTKLPPGLENETLVTLMRSDKKMTNRRAGQLTFVLFGPGGLAIVNDVPETAVLDVLNGMPAAP